MTKSMSERDIDAISNKVAILATKLNELSINTTGNDKVLRYDLSTLLQKYAEQRHEFITLQDKVKVLESFMELQMEVDNYTPKTGIIRRAWRWLW